jgi:hypothetical protein
VSTISDSILDNTKKVLGMEADYTAFDVDVIMHINSVLSTLNQLGIGPLDGFAIEDTTQTWADFLDDVKPLNNVKSYVYLRTRMLFDPPTTSFLLESMKQQIDELGWRISTYRESLQPLLVPDVAEEDL